MKTNLKSHEDNAFTIYHSHIILIIQMFVSGFSLSIRPVGLWPASHVNSFYNG